MIGRSQDVFGTPEEVVGLENEQQLVWNGVEEASDVGEVEHGVGPEAL